MLHRTIAAIGFSGLCLSSCSEITHEAPQISTILFGNGVGELDTTKTIVQNTISDRIAATVPAFAGMYRDADRLVLLVAAPASSNDHAAAVAAVKAALDPDNYEYNEVVTQEATYSLQTLRKYEYRVFYLMHTHGIHTFGVAEKENKLRLRIASEAGQNSLLKDLDLTGIPRNAVEILIEPPITPLSTK